MNNSDPTFSDDVLKFIKHANKNDIKLFIIDPIILYNLLKDNEKKLLIDRKILAQSILENIDSHNKNLISFGIFQNDLKKFEVNFLIIINY